MTTTRIPTPRQQALFAAFQEGIARAEALAVGYRFVGAIYEAEKFGYTCERDRRMYSAFVKGYLDVLAERSITTDATDAIVNITRVKRPAPFSGPHY